MTVTVGIPRLTKITVNDVDVTTYAQPSACKDGDYNGEPSSFLLFLLANVENVLGSISKEFLIGKKVEFSRGVSSNTEQYQFRGEVVNAKRDGRILQLDCRDHMWRAVKKVETNIYQASDSTLGNPKAIYTDLMRRARVPLNEAYIIDPGVNYTRNRFIVDTANVKERADALVRGLDNWRHYYDSDLDTARMEPAKYEDSGVTLTVGREILNQPEWDNKGEKLVQVLTVRGATEEALTEESFNGDSSTTEFTLAFQPESVRVLISGVEKTLGIPGVTTTSYDYYVDKVNKKIIFLAAPATGTGNIVVTYGYKQERPVQVSNPGSIAKYATQGTEQYPYEDVTHVLDAVDIDDARLYAEGALVQDSEVENNTKLFVKGYTGWKKNMRVSVIDAKNNINESVVIRAIETKYPYVADILHVNRVPIDDAGILGNVYTRVKRLEENTNTGTKSLFVIKPLGRKVGVAKKQYYKRKRTWNSGTYSGFILDHPKYGVLDASGFDAVDKGSSWYKLEENSNDEYGLANGTDTNVTYTRSTNTDGIIAHRCAQYGAGATGTALAASNTMITNNSAWTIALRAKAISTASGVAIGLATTTTNTAVKLYFSSAGNFGWAYRDGGGTVTDMTTTTPGTTWAHYVLTYDGTTYRAYVNGVLSTSATDTFAGFGTGTANIGTLGTDYYNGYIADVRLYDGHVLTAEEIDGLYNDGEVREENELYYTGWDKDWILPGNDVFREYLKSTEDFDMTRSDPSYFNTTNQTLTAGSVKAVYLGPISKGPSVTRARVTVYFTGTAPTIRLLSGYPLDNLQTFGVLTSGVAKTLSFTTPLTTIIMQIILGSSTVVYTPKNAYGVPTAPAIKFELLDYT